MSQVNGDHRPPYQVFPDLNHEEFETLKCDIAERSVQVAVEITETGDVQDGHQRVRACQEPEIKNYPRRIISGLDDQGKRYHAITANCLRRQLTRQQRRDVNTADEATRYLQALVPKGSLVIDPCMRNATTGVAALRCGMRFVGCEIDAGAYQGAVQRLSQERRSRRP